MNSAAGSATRLQADFVLSGGDFNQSAAKSTGALHRTPCPPQSDGGALGVYSTYVLTPE